MTGSEDVVTQYIDRCARMPDLRNAARNLALPKVYGKSYGNLLLDRPMLAQENELNLFGDDLVVLFGVLASIPKILFDGDLRACCSALGMDDRLAAMMCKGTTGQLPVHGRADAYHDGKSFKLLEFNIGSELGGTDAAQVNRGFLGVPAFGEFARDQDLRYIDTAARVADVLRATATRITASGEPVVALLESTGGLAGHEHVFLALREAMCEHGIDLRLGEIHEIAEHNGKITLHGVPVDVVLRFFVAGEIVGSAPQEEAFDRILRADAADKTALFTSLEAGVLASKGSLALLHDPLLRESLTPAQRETIDRVVPWTRLLSSGGHRSCGDRAELVDLCRANRETLVIKPGVGYGAVGTTLGRETAPDRWDDVLADSANGDYVVQQLVTPAPEPVVNPDTGVIEDWRANWGIFVDSGGYSGAFVRALKAVDGSVISYSHPGTGAAASSPIRPVLAPPVTESEMTWPTSLPARSYSRMWSSSPAGGSNMPATLSIWITAPIG